MQEYTLKQTELKELGVPIRGKVRDIYEQDGCLIFVATDRISVFDTILPQAIPGKGRVLTELSAFWFKETAGIIENHLIANPDPNVLVVKKCRPLAVEVIVRKYLVGSLWRDYAAGARAKAGAALPDGLKRNDPLPRPIVTPTTKSQDGHDVDITPDELIRQGIVDAEQWNRISSAALQLFAKGAAVAIEKGLILVDTKYEFGVDAFGTLTLIDEVLTPDSSRYWLVEDKENHQLRFPDKEFAREWAMEQGFMGEGPAPDIPDEVRSRIAQGYREIVTRMTGKTLPPETEPIEPRIERNLQNAHVLMEKMECTP